MMTLVINLKYELSWANKALRFGHFTLLFRYIYKDKFTRSNSGTQIERGYTSHSNFRF